MSMLIKFLTIFFLFTLLGCGKIGPLTLPEDQLDKSVITYPCDEACEKRFEEEKKRQQSVTLQFN
ncbi:MAG: hypothetical protein CFH19_00005 [Alphaproteobacteria bacterium MarineAlpha5_Bin9]|nr:MAG: hypothetical protein CFH19_00005 [Alphaproteobacteria bacterium MarineAlpha5_Bin9]|tara:strand:+ start:5803 stop:5997 length:195 start_codon:yes stop_codon:yes gene_type:complete